MNAVTFCGMAARLTAEPYSATDYEDALKRHYASGAPPTWQQEFVSAYATSHPWEDFSETFAHYLHIVDTLDTARAFGLRTRHAVPDGDVLRAKIEFDPHRCRDINQIIARIRQMTR
jgi:hypothetical protein